jgi:hypothetical protein
VEAFQVSDTWALPALAIRPVGAGGGVGGVGVVMVTLSNVAV